MTAAAPGPPVEEAGGVLTIDLGAVVDNWRVLARRAAGAECSAVVKADAYGCGIEPVASRLAGAGCRTFFVAQLAEGRRVRAQAPGVTVYVLNGLLPGTASAYAKDDLRPVLGNRDEIEEWAAFRTATDWQGGAALHVDTGMNRLGLPLAEGIALANTPLGARAGIALVMSHLACAEETAHPKNAEQIARFREVRRAFGAIPGSLVNSSGIFLGLDARHDLVRPGVALYGANPTPGRANPMRPVVRLQARVLQVRQLAPGETVGYGATWTARQDARIAIVSAGYGDGYLRSASASDVHAGGLARIAERPCPIVGRVSMDLLALDVTELPAGSVRRGEWASLIDETIDLDRVAECAGTIAYEILTSLGRRYRRVYVGV